MADLGLKAVGEAVTSGAGEGHETTGFVHFDEIAMGAVRLRDEIGFATEGYDKSIGGIPVDGMIGFELIRRMVTRIDYGRFAFFRLGQRSNSPPGAGPAAEPSP